MNLKEREIPRIKEKNEQIPGEKNVKLEGYGSLLNDSELNAQDCFKICQMMPECNAATFQDSNSNIDSQNEEGTEKSCVLFEVDLYASVENKNWISYIKRD